MNRPSSRHPVPQSHGEPRQPAVPNETTDTHDAPVVAEFAQLIEAMHEHLDEPLSIESMAEIAGLSTFHFLRSFSEQTGVPPGRFLTALRFLYAQKLLITTDLSVTDICFEAGFNSLGTFTRRFHQLLGITPSGLRQVVDRSFGGSETVIETFLPKDPDDPPKPDDSTELGPPIELSFSSDHHYERYTAGIFQGVLPQGRPAACGTSLEPSLRLEARPAGPRQTRARRIFAVGWTPDSRVRDLVNWTADRFAVAMAVLPEPSDRPGDDPIRLSLDLNPRNLTDPPPLFSLPMLLAELQERSRTEVR